MNLIDLLPSFYHDSDFVKAFMSSQTIEANLLKEDLVNNLYVKTATWGLAYFEEELGLYTDISKPYEERRERILAKKRGNGTTTVKMLKDTALAFECGEVDIEEKFNEYKFVLKFVSQKGRPKNLEDFKNMIEEIKPCHLAYEFVFLYNTNNDLKPFTHNYLSRFSHDFLKNEFDADSPIEPPPIDNPPTIQAINDISVTVDEAFQISYIATDDNGIIKHELSENGGTTFKEISPTKNNDTYTLSKVYSSEGDRQLKVRVTDSNNQYIVSNNFTVKVKSNVVNVENIVLDKNSLTLDIGDTYTINATVNPSNATNKSVSWSSSDSNVATVNNGTVEAIGNGTTRILCTSNANTSVSSYCDVVVNVRPPIGADWSINNISDLTNDSYWTALTVQFSKAINVTKFERCKKTTGDFGVWENQTEVGDNKTSLFAWIETANPPFIHKVRVTDDKGNVVESNEFKCTLTT